MSSFETYINRSDNTVAKDGAETERANGNSHSETMNAPLSPIGNNPMQLRMTIPLDWRRPAVRKGYKLFWCDISQFGMLYPRPDDAEIATFYDLADYYTHDKFVTTSPSAMNKPSFTGWMLKRLSWQFDKSVYIDRSWFERHHGNSKKSVLDVGCGSGKILSLLKSAGHTVIGIEPDPRAREIAISRGLEVFDGTAENLPPELESEQFDAVIMTHVLEHFADPLKAMNNAAALLKSGGKLTVETPNHAAIGFNKAGSVWRWLDVPRHLNFFTPQSLSAMCEMAGLELVSTEYRGYSRQFESEWISDEQRIWDRYKASNSAETALPKRNTEWQSWKLFAKTLMMPDEKRYDSIRVIARKP